MTESLPAVGRNRLIAAIVAILALLAWAVILHLDGIPPRIQWAITFGILGLGGFHAVQLDRGGAG